jgi:hypothetical protein
VHVASFAQPEIAINGRVHRPDDARRTANRGRMLNDIEVIYAELAKRLRSTG